MDEGKAKQEEKGLIAYQSRDGQQIRLSFDIIRKYLVSGKRELVTDQELMVYAGTCKAKGLNPFKRDCYLVKYNEEPAATIVSIDWLRSRAKAMPDSRGWKSGIIVKNEEGQVEKREGAFIAEGEALLGGWFRATPEGWAEPFEWTVNLAPYIKKTREGKATKFWQEDNQAYMIAKVAEGQGLRRVWPDDFAKLYIKEEIVEGFRPDTEPLPMPQSLSEKKEKPAVKPQEKEGPPDDSDIAGAQFDVILQWLKESPDAEILAAKATQLLEGIDKQSHAAVLKAYNDRRKEIEAKAKGNLL